MLLHVSMGMRPLGYLQIFQRVQTTKHIFTKHTNVITTQVPERFQNNAKHYRMVIQQKVKFTPQNQIQIQLLIRCFLLNR